MTRSKKIEATNAEIIPPEIYDVEASYQARRLPLFVYLPSPEDREIRRAIPRNPGGAAFASIATARSVRSIYPYLRCRC